MMGASILDVHLVFVYGTDDKINARIPCGCMANCGEAHNVDKPVKQKVI